VAFNVIGRFVAVRNEYEFYGPHIRDADHSPVHRITRYRQRTVARRGADSAAGVLADHQSAAVFTSEHHLSADSIERDRESGLFISIKYIGRAGADNIQCGGGSLPSGLNWVYRD